MYDTWSETKRVRLSVFVTVSSNLVFSNKPSNPAVAAASPMRLRFVRRLFRVGGGSWHRGTLG